MFNSINLVYLRKRHAKKTKEQRRKANRAFFAPPRCISLRSLREILNPLSKDMEYSIFIYFPKWIVFIDN